LFVGDEPSSANEDAKIAFKGTKSGVRLKQWAEILNVTYYAVNSHDLEALHRAIKLYVKFTAPIITLGIKAHKRVQKIARDNGYDLRLYNLPHPSGRNRKLNDKQYIVNKLKDCKDWLFPN
jgi:hypothetical protein